MTPADEIDALIAKTPDWRGDTFAQLRATILSVDPAITEEWKYMGSPVWELDGPLCVGNIHKTKVKLVFANGAALSDPTGMFNAELGGSTRRAVEFLEGDQPDDAALASLIQEAIDYRREKARK